MSILSLLLRSSSIPLLSPKYEKVLPALFDRLARFIRTNPGDSSLHHDYLVAVSAALSHVSLNARKVVSKFAHEAWDGLIGMWGTKNQKMKQDLVVVIRSLLPFLTAQPTTEGEMPEFAYGDGVAKLWHLLNAEVENRWGVHGLSLDCLRLQVVEPNGEAGTCGAFIADTFRYGWHFDSNQALAWAVLELQADCTEKVAV